MKTTALFLFVFVIGSAFLFACAPSNEEPDAQAVEHSKRGFDYQTQGQLDLAIEEYTKAIDLDPQLALVYNNRGIAYADKGDIWFEYVETDNTLVDNIDTVWHRGK